MKTFKNFASDNTAGVHPAILEAIIRANTGDVPAYGADHYTQAARRKFEEHFGPEIELYFLFTGTAANILGLKAVMQPFQAVICSESAHINQNECGAPEGIIGCKLITIPSTDGKITMPQIAKKLEAIGNQHCSQPQVVSLSQATELGTVYTPEEIKVIADFTHQQGMLLHMDGARIANAAAALNLPLRAITGDAGVDVLSFGGTKNGLMFGEAVVFFNKELGLNFKYLRKQNLQLMSKMRFLAVQFETLLSNDLWLKNARNSNDMAKLLAGELARIPSVKITQKVETNVVFAVIPPQYIPPIQEKFHFYVWDEEISEVRLMTAFDTTAEDVGNFITTVREVLGK